MIDGDFEDLADLLRENLKDPKDIKDMCELLMMWLYEKGFEVEYLSCDGSFNAIKREVL